MIKHERIKVKDKFMEIKKRFSFGRFCNLIGRCIDVDVKPLSNTRDGFCTKYEVLVQWMPFFCLRNCFGRSHVAHFRIQGTQAADWHPFCLRDTFSSTVLLRISFTQHIMLLLPTIRFTSSPAFFPRILLLGNRSICFQFIWIFYQQNGILLNLTDKKIMYIIEINRNIHW